MTFISQAFQQLRPVDRVQNAVENAIENAVQKGTPLALALPQALALDPLKQLDARRVFAASACDHPRDFSDEPSGSRPRRGLSSTSAKEEANPVADLAETATEAATSTLLGQSLRLGGSGLAVAGAIVDDVKSERLKGIGNKLGVAGALVGLASFADNPSLDSGARAAAGATGVAAIFAKDGAKAVLGKVGTVATVGFSVFDTIQALRDGNEGKAATAALPAIGAGVGAGIGALGFGVGAVPGAAIGAAVGSGLSAGINIVGELF
jgi:hypothetical protein